MKRNKNSTSDNLESNILSVLSKIASHENACNSVTNPIEASTLKPNKMAKKLGKKSAVTKNEQEKEHPNVFLRRTVTNVGSSSLIIEPEKKKKNTFTQIQVTVFNGHKNTSFELGKMSEDPNHGVVALLDHIFSLTGFEKVADINNFQGENTPLNLYRQLYVTALQLEVQLLRKATKNWKESCDSELIEKLGSYVNEYKQAVESFNEHILHDQDQHKITKALEEKTNVQEKVIEQLKHKIAKLQDSLTQKENDCRAIVEISKKSQKQFQLKESKLFGISKRCDELEEENKNLENDIKKLKENTVKELEREIACLKKTNKDFEIQSKILEESNNTLKLEYENLKQEIQKCRSDHIELEKLKKINEDLESAAIEKIEECARYYIFNDRLKQNIREMSKKHSLDIKTICYRHENEKNAVIQDYGSRMEALKSTVFHSIHAAQHGYLFQPQCPNTQ